MNKKNKIKLIKDYANTLGICRKCVVREVFNGHNICVKCIEANTKASRKLRQKKDRCSRCARKLSDLSFKCCEHCRK